LQGGHDLPIQLYDELMAGVTSMTSNSADDGTHAVVPENANGLVEPVNVGVDFSTTSPNDAAIAAVGDDLGAESGAEGDTILVDHVTGETSSPDDVCGDANAAQVSITRIITFHGG
jgi:hypothetical protein